MTVPYGSEVAMRERGQSGIPETLPGAEAQGTRPRAEGKILRNPKPRGLCLEILTPRASEHGLIWI